MLRVLALGLAIGAWAAAGSHDYQGRREALRKALPNAVIVLAGETETSHDVEVARGPFFQEPNFYYLTGWKEPGAKLLLHGQIEILFLPLHNPDREKWTGPRLSADDPHISAITGFHTVLPLDRFDDELHGLPAPIDSSTVQKALAQLRMKKSQTEIALIQHAADATVAAHLAAWRSLTAGMYEYQVAARAVSVYLDQGCERSAYAPIVAAGPDGVYLHYNRNSRRIESGELLLMDAGAECAGYTADVTRTVPVSGKFTARQREIYDVVLGAQKAVIAAVKPGMTIGRNTPRSLYQVAYSYINSHGRDLHGQPLGKYFTHGISHHIGLEVHDASDNMAPLSEGMVISVEPGIYIPEEHIGIRIEDMVLVTANGAQVLTASLPKEAAEIDKRLTSKNPAP